MVQDKKSYVVVTDKYGNQNSVPVYDNCTLTLNIQDGRFISAQRSDKLKFNYTNQFKRDIIQILHLKVFIVSVRQSKYSFI